MVALTTAGPVKGERNGLLRYTEPYAEESPDLCYLESMCHFKMIRFIPNLKFFYIILQRCL